jgi:hypothetical protein
VRRRRLELFAEPTVRKPLRDEQASALRTRCDAPSAEPLASRPARTAVGSGRRAYGRRQPRSALHHRIEVPLRRARRHELPDRPVGERLGEHRQTGWAAAETSILTELGPLHKDDLAQRLRDRGVADPDAALKLRWTKSVVRQGNWLTIGGVAADSASPCE